MKKVITVVLAGCFCLVNAFKANAQEPSSGTKEPPPLASIDAAMKTRGSLHKVESGKSVAVHGDKSDLKMTTLIVAGQDDGAKAKVVAAGIRLSIETSGDPASTRSGFLDLDECQAIIDEMSLIAAKVESMKKHDVASFQVEIESKDKTRFGYDQTGKSQRYYVTIGNRTADFSIEGMKELRSGLASELSELKAQRKRFDKGVEAQK